MQKKYHEKNSRSLAKSLTFRVVVISSDIIVIYILTHRIDLVIGVTIATNVASMILYYLHERVWNMVRWGKVKN